MTESKNIFAERLEKLIKENNYTHENVANGIAVTRQAVGKWVKGDSVPDVLTAAKLAEFFKVSVDYLAGTLPHRTPDKELSDVCEYTGLSEEAVERIKIVTEQRDEVDRSKIISELILDWDFAYLSTLLYKYICADSKHICKFGVGLEHLAIHQDKLIESQITNTMLGIAKKLKSRLENDFESAKKLHQIASERYSNIMNKSNIQRLVSGEITEEEHEALLYEYSKGNFDYNPHSHKYDEILDELLKKTSNHTNNDINNE